MSQSIARIDFETRSALDLKKVGVYKYAQDFSTIALCMAYKLPKQPVKLWYPGCGFPLFDLFFWVEDGGLVESHNAEFEYCIWNYVQRKHGWPQLPWNQLRCSAAKAAALSLPRSLEGLCDVLDTEVKKDKDGKKIMLRLSKLKRPSKKDPELWDEDPAKRQKLFEYCIDDVLSEESASQELYDLTPREQKFFELTAKTNERGIYCDVELCRKAFEFSKRFERDIQSELKVVTNGFVKTAKQVAANIEFLKSEGLETDNLQAKTVQALLQRKDLTNKARRVLEIRAQLSKSSISKFKAMIEMSCRDQRIRGTLLFHGASTGRDTGKGIQPQNYPRGTAKDSDKIIESLENDEYFDFKLKYPNVFEALSNCLRGMLRAAPGKILRIADYAAIEARVVLWLAGDEDGLQEFRNKVDVYKSMARVIYSMPETAEVSKEQRQLGKQAVLGCGYGMGAPKFQITCLSYNMDVNEELAKKAVTAYRTKYWKVKNLWADVEHAAIRAVESPGRVFTASKVKFFVKERFLFCELPSGRRLAYRDPALKEEDRGWGAQKRLCYYAPHAITKKWDVEQTYGGKLVENITQAVARDLMLEACAKLEMSGYPIVLRVHDEIISECDPEQGSIEHFENIMSSVPKWAEGCPITVEGFESERYKK